MIEGQQGIREAYRDDEVAREYVHRRFREPLGAMLHERQVACMRAVIAELRPRHVLEIAPGPARLTVDLASSFDHAGVLLDASAQMLNEAQARLKAAGVSGWRRVQGDAFHLPFAGAVDLVYSFRLIRHFDDGDRVRLYEEIARILRPGGVLVFDAVNEKVSRPLRQKPGQGGQHYDALLTPEKIAREVEAAGFRILSLTGVQHHYPILYNLQVLVAPRSRRLADTAMRLVDRIPAGQPLEWIVTCQRA
jgi:SAM-dependent methyltransferase